MQPRGFTLLEVTVTIAILGVIFFLSTSGLSLLQQSIAAQSVDREVVNVLSTAARRGVETGECISRMMTVPAPQQR